MRPVGGAAPVPRGAAAPAPDCPLCPRLAAFREASEIVHGLGIDVSTRRNEHFDYRCVVGYGGEKQGRILLGLRHCIDIRACRNEHFDDQ